MFKFLLWWFGWIDFAGIFVSAVVAIVIEGLLGDFKSSTSWRLPAFSICFIWVWLPGLSDWPLSMSEINEKDLFKEIPETLKREPCVLDILDIAGIWSNEANLPDKLPLWIDSFVLQSGDLSSS